MMDENVRFRSLGGAELGASFARPRNSKAEVLQYFIDLAEEWEMLTYEVDEYIAQGDRVAVLVNCSWRHRRAGKFIDTPKADFLTMRDGRIVDFSEFFDIAKVQACIQD